MRKSARKSFDEIVNRKVEQVLGGKISTRQNKARLYDESTVALSMCSELTEKCKAFTD
jgi:hypothetical protein